MKITFKLYASLTDYLPPQARGDNRIELDVASGATIAQVSEPFGLPNKLVHLVLVNGVYVPPAERATRTLSEGDVLAIWPPIAGG
ncbi:MAG TPA: molybdopterin synthase sulfur carrier subunit [Curvibacter sp.]|nr:molybdopterin synthase sulfur carrier subunit [Curvibacter sp.]